MPYKGDDLDLRVPHPRPARELDLSNTDYEPSAGSRWPRPAKAADSHAPIWVDETVLQCCNFAFDLASAQASTEVGLDHLVHALTRVDAAARVLEARGVREGQLRRESAALLSRDNPASHARDRTSPRRSGDLEELLRRASERASRRGHAASVDEVLWTALSFAPDIPVIALLRRLTPDWQRQDWNRSRELAVSDHRGSDVANGLDATLPRPAFVDDAARGLLAELVGERRALTELMRSLQRDLHAQREAGMDGTRGSPPVAERMQALEKAVHAGLGEGARNWAALGQRLLALEAAVAERVGGAEQQPVLQKLSALQEALDGRTRESSSRWTEFAHRLAAIDKRLVARAVDPSSTTKALVDRLGGLEVAVRSGFGETLRLGVEARERIDAVEKVARERQRLDDEALLLLDERLGGIERALEDRSGLSVGMASEVVTRIGALEERFQDPAGALAKGIVEASAPIVARVDGIAKSVTERVTEANRLLRETGERLVGVEQMMRTGAEAADVAFQMRDREMQDMQDAIVRLAENQHTLASAIADWRHGVHTDFGTVNARMEKLIDLMMPAVPSAPAANVASASASAPAGAPNTASEPMEPTPDAGGGGLRDWLMGLRRRDRSNWATGPRVLRLKQRLRSVRIRLRGAA